jgi:cysteinyl-tRNA synthetase
MKIYNTLTRKKEIFYPIDKEVVRIYSCGPTVYNYAHIGNFRTYIFMDILRRVFQYEGYMLKHVMNITDVGHLVSDSDEGEDKMLKSAREQQKSPWEIANYYTEVFFRDIKELNIQKPEIVPRATEHISEMIQFVKSLLEAGYGYETRDGIYFDIGKFDGYGKLSRINLDEQIAGARVEVNEEKRHPADFALWKKAPREHIMQWDSPWGRGYPGWHIECSAMGQKYLGDYFDIHTGGVDHIPIHHENEIAQTEALLGKPAVKYWMHSEFLLVDNGKMSKSLGNVYTISDLKEKGFKPIVFRYFCLNAHYRNKLNFTWDAINASKTAYSRFVNGALEHKKAIEQKDKIDIGVINRFRNEFESAVSDDLNIPKALGIAWNVIKNKEKSRELFNLLLEFDKILGLDLDIAEEKKENEKKDIKEPEIDDKVKSLIEKRQQAREAKNWDMADKIREELGNMGIIIKDTPKGARIVFKDKDNI